MQVSVTTPDIHHQNWIRLIITKGKWYLLSSLFTKGLSLLLLPIYTRYLPPADFGILNTLLAMALILPVFMSLYLDAAFGRFYHEYKRDVRRLRVLFSSVYWFVMVWGGAVLGLTLATASVWAPHVLRVSFSYIIVAFVPMLFLQVGQLGVVFLRQSLDSSRTTFLDVSSATISMVVTVPLLVFWHMGVMARLIGILFQAAFLFSYYTWFFRSRGLLGRVCDLHVLKLSLAYSIPLVPNIASGWISGLSDRLILAKYASVQAVGLYSLAVTLSSVLYVLQDAVTQVTGAVSMSGLVHDREPTLRKMAQLSLLMWALMLTADLGVTLFARELVATFATREYAGAATIIGVCGFTYVLAAQYRLFSDVVGFRKQTWVVSSGGLLMAGTSLGLNFLLVPRIGYLAAAYTWVTATLVYTGWIVLWSRRYERIDLPWVRMATLLLMFFGGCWSLALFNGTTLMNLAAKVAIEGAFGGLSFVIVRSSLDRGSGLVAAFGPIAQS